MKFLVLQHIDCEHPGIFRDLMRESDITWDTVPLDQSESIPDLDGYDVLMVMGGPMDVWQITEHPWLEQEVAAIRQWVRADRPYLGLCLGHQLLAVAMDGKVGPAIHPEIGVLPVELTHAGRTHWFFRQCRPEIMALQWHSAEVTVLPSEAVVLAHSDACQVNAMAIGQYAVSVQFHIEITQTTVKEWHEVPEYAAALARARGQGAMANLQHEADRHLESFNSNARLLFGNFLARIH